MHKWLRNLSRPNKSSSPTRINGLQIQDSGEASQSLTLEHTAVADTLKPVQEVKDPNPVDALGLSVLFEPRDPPAIDIIFVHGLGGASVRTWCKDHDPSLCWPKHWLPEDLGRDQVRVLTFGYHAEIFSSNKTRANISDFAKSLLADMRFGSNAAMQDLGIGKAPIVFVVHSMGGLVFKKAYLRGQGDREYRGIVSQIQAVLFLSTPHRGSNLAETLDRIISISSAKFSRKTYVQELASSSITIEDLNEDFRHQVCNLEIFSFYELRKTMIKGHYSAMIVSRDSSVLGYPEESSIPLEADHHDVCKFASRTDANYRSVVSVLKMLTKKHTRTIKSRNEHDVQESLLLKKTLALKDHIHDDYGLQRDSWASGTCEWILRDKNFLTWIQERQSAGILWMNADPGTGKSVKSSFLTQHFLVSNFVCQYHFFNSDDPLKRSVSSLMRSLAFQISQIIPSFRAALIRYIEDGSLSDETGSRKLWRLLFELTLFRMQFDQPMFWVIDGLDESDSATGLISSLAKIPKTLPIRILLVSRQLPSISLALQRASSSISVQKFCLADNMQDIQIFIEKEVVYLPGDQRFHSVVSDQLLRRSEGNFLWVHLALQELQQIHDEGDLGRILDEIPNGMDPMYTRMVASIGQLSKDSDQLLSKLILMWTTYSKRPLLVDEFLHVLKPKFAKIINLRDSINRVCGDFIVIDKANKVTLIHSTARDYLRQTTKLPFDLEPHSSHATLFKTTIQALHDPQFRLCLSRKKMLTFGDYASTSWFYHLERCPADNADVLSTLVNFFGEPSVLAWIEALALCKQLNNISASSKSLHRFIQRCKSLDTEQNSQSPRLSELEKLEMWAKDLSKLVGKFGSYLLEDSTIIYRLIPQLCPVQSALHARFGDLPSSRILLKGLDRLEWDDLSARISIGNSKQAMLLGCSNTYLAISTSARSVTVWNTVSFQEVSTLDHEEHVLRMFLSPSGNKLITYGLRDTKVWTVNDGSALGCARNPGHIKPVALTLLEDGETLLMCSSARDFWKLSLEDMSQGWSRAFSGVLNGPNTIAATFTNSPTSLDFNSDASQIAVAYRGAPLEIWDLVSCKLVNRCLRSSRASVNHRFPWAGVNRVLWHPFDYEILGLYTDGIVFKWQPVTELHYELSGTPDSSPMDIQISPTGNVFLTSDVYGTIGIYSFYDFRNVYKVSSGDMITDICFSPDGQRIYDIRASYCNVWEPDALAPGVEIDEQESDFESEVGKISKVPIMASGGCVVDTLVTITALAVNPTITLICFGNDQGILTVYDIRNDTKSQIARSSTGMGIERVEWSCDGKYIIYEDLGRDISVLALTDHGGPNPKSGLTTQGIITTVLLEGEPIRTLIANPCSSALLAIGDENGQVLNLDTREPGEKRRIQPSSAATWLQHPKDVQQVLALNCDSVTAFTWQDETVSRLHEWQFENQSDQGTVYDRLKGALSSPCGQYILLLESRCAMKTRDGEDLRIRMLALSSLHLLRGTVPTVSLPEPITSQIERVLAILESDLLVFVDKAFWICTWRYDYQELLRAQAPPADTTTMLRRSDAQSYCKEDLYACITRHFFLPPDWVNSSSLALCTMLSDGTFLCPRNGDLAIIKSRLGSGW